MQSIAITGASGFIGRHVAAAFKNTGATVRGFSRANVHPYLIPLNYLDLDSAVRAIDGVEVLVHIAGLAHVSPKSLDDPSARYREGNVDVAVSMARASIQAGVRKFILLSSAGVLGQASPPGGFNDSSPAMPYDAYTASKWEAEQQVLEVVGGHIAVSILRPPMVYGAGAPGSYRRLCKWIDRGLPLPLGSIVARRSFVGIRNLCDLLISIAASNKEVPRDQPTMLVADANPGTVADFARQIAYVRGKHARLLPVPSWVLERTLAVAGLQEEYRRFALPFELAPSRASDIFEWQPPYSTGEELACALTGEPAVQSPGKPAPQRHE